MKTKIGLPLGLALVMFIGVFTTMLALGVLAPQPASAAIDSSKGITVDSSLSAAGAYADWTFGFQNDSTAIAATADIVISITNTASGADCANDADDTNVCIEANWSVDYVVADDPATTDVDETDEVDVGVTSVAVADEDLTADPQVFATTTIATLVAIPANAAVTITYTQPRNSDGSPNTALGGIRNGVTPGDTMTATVNTVDATGEDNIITILDLPANVTATNNPTEPGVTARFSVGFTTLQALAPNASEIVVRFDKDILGTGDLPDNRVAVRFTNGAMTDDSPAVLVYPYEGAAVGMTAPSRTLVDGYGRVNEEVGDRNIVEYTFTVPDMDPNRDAVNGIPADSRVEVTFSSSAGIRNPTEASTRERISVSTSEQQYFSSDFIDVDLTLYVDDVKDKRDTSLTVFGKGYKNGTTATIWLELDGTDHPDNTIGVIDDNETVLLRVPVAGDDTFEATFNVSVPPFIRGPGNMINARDTEQPDINVLEANLPEFHVDKTMTVSPSTASVGDTVRIEIKDHPDYNDDTVYSRVCRCWRCCLPYDRRGCPLAD